MKKNFALLALLVVGHGISAAQNGVCKTVACVQAEMDQIGKADEMDPAKAAAAQKIVAESEWILRTRIAKKMDPASTAEMIHLLARAIPYDPSLEFVQDNMNQFHKRYVEPNSVLKSTMEQMVHENCAPNDNNCITRADYNLILDSFGLSTGQGANDKSKTEKKSPNKVAAQPCPSSTPRQATGVTSGALGALKNALTNPSQVAPASSSTSGIAQTTEPSSRAPASVTNPRNGSSNNRGPASVSPTYYPEDDSAVSQ